MSLENPFNQPPASPEEEPAQQGLEKRPERGPVSYERAFEAAKSLRARGIEDPLNLEPEDPATQEVLDIIEDWEIAAGLHETGIHTASKARDLVRAGTIWLAAGYSDEEVIQGAIENLNDNYAVAVREGNDEVIKIFADAIQDIEQNAPREAEVHAFEYLQGRFEIGQQMLAEGKFADAVGVFSGILTDPFFSQNEALTGKLRGEIEGALMVARASYEKEQAPQRIAAAEIRSSIDKAIELRNAGQYREACAALSEAQTQARAAKLRSLFDEAGDRIDEINRKE
jgi:hypothetical protein